MKRQFSQVLSLLATAIVALSSCDPKEEEIKPVFPESQTIALTADETREFTITPSPNLDWKLEIVSESAGWFWILDGTSQVYTLHGAAGDAVSVKVGTTDQEDFDTIHKADLVLTMGGISQTVATFVRDTRDRTISVKVCEVEDGDFMYREEYDQNIHYEYGDTIAADAAVELIWNVRTKDFSRAILVNANFDWQVKSAPEWVSVKEDSKTGEAYSDVEIVLGGNGMFYPADGGESTVVFCARDNAEKEFSFKVVIPAHKDMFGISGFSQITEFTAAGEHEGMSGLQAGAVRGSVLSHKDVVVYTFELIKEMFSSFYDNSNVTWLHASLSDWDDEAGVIQESELSVGVDENTGEAREGIVIVIPAEKAPKESWSIFPDGLNIAPEYAPYVATVVKQEALKVKGSFYPVDEDWFKDLGEWSVSSETWVLQDFGVEEAFDLKYTTSFANDEQGSFLGGEVLPTSFKFYDFDCELMSEENSWLSVDQSTIGFRIVMDPSKDTATPAGQDHTGFVVLYVDNVAKAVIICTFSEKSGSSSDAAVAFTYSDMVSGATLTQVTMDNLAAMNALYSGYGLDFTENIVMGEPVFVLEYTTAQPMMAMLTVPSMTIMTMPMPMSGTEWCTYEQMDMTSILITMEKPSSEDSPYADVQIWKANYSGFTHIYCIPNF